MVTMRGEDKKMQAKMSLMENKIQTKTLPWMIWACGAIFYFYQFILRVSPSVMNQDLMMAFGVHGCALGALASAYYNAYAAMQIPLGISLDKYGPRRVLILSCLLCVVGSILFAASPTLMMAALGRTLIGAGSACAFIGTLKLATLWFPPAKVGMVVGLTMLLGTVGASSGKAPLAMLIDYQGWRGAIFTTALIGVSLLVSMIFILKDRKSGPLKKSEGDLSDQPQEPWKFFKAFLNVMSTSQVWLVALFGSLMYVPLAAFADLWGDHFLMDRYGIDRKIAGSITMWIYWGIAAGSPLTTMLSDSLKSRRIPMRIAGVFSCLVYLAILYLPIPIAFMPFLMFVAGLSFCGQILIFASVVEIMPVWVSGISLAFTNMIVMMSGVIFQPVVGRLLDLSWNNGPLKDGVPDYSLTDWRLALITLPLCLLAAFFVTFFIRETYPKEK